MKNRVLTFALILFSFFKTPAQTPDKQKIFAEANEFFITNKYGLACSLYLDLIKEEPLSADLNYKIGVCYLQSRSQKYKALSYLEKAIQYTPALTNNADPKKTDAPVVAYKFLGDAYCINYKFDQAIEAYEKYKELAKQRKINEPNLVTIINGKIETCKLGKELKELVALPVKIKTDKPGKAIDTSFKNCSSALSADKSTMIFTYKIPVSKIQKIQDASYYEDTYIKSDTTKQSVATKTVFVPQPDTTIYVTTIGTSVDGQIVLTYKNEFGNGNLYISRLRNNQWSVPLRLSKSNNPAGWEPNESISPDGNTLYFVSNREGGYGGKDIYRCKKLPDGSWSKAINMGPEINTSYNEEAPVIHPDGSTLFFSSNKTKPKEYFENFMVSVTEGEATGKPIAIGYPVDKNNGQVFYEVAADAKKTLSKSKTAKKIKQLQLDSLKAQEKSPDEFLITFMNQKKVPLTLLKGKFSEAGIATQSVQIIVSDNETGKIQGIYHADNKSGQFSFILSSGRNNNITYEAPGHLFVSENKTLLKDSAYFGKYNIIALPLIAKGSKSKLENIFFEDRKGAPLYSSNFEINKLSEFMLNNPNVWIRITNTIYTNTEKKFYKKLSSTRAEAVKQELVAKGVAENRISIDSRREKLEQPKKDKSYKKTVKLPDTKQELEFEITEIK